MPYCIHFYLLFKESYIFQRWEILRAKKIHYLEVKLCKQWETGDKNYIYQKRWQKRKTNSGLSKLATGLSTDIKKKQISFSDSNSGHHLAQLVTKKGNSDQSCSKYIKAYSSQWFCPFTQKQNPYVFRGHLWSFHRW